MILPFQEEGGERSKRNSTFYLEGCLLSSPFPTLREFHLQYIGRNNITSARKMAEQDFKLGMWASLVAQMVKNLPAMLETWIQLQGREDPLEKGKATLSSILAWRLPCTGEFLAGYSPWGCKESDTTEKLTLSLYVLSQAVSKKNSVFLGLP